MPRQSINFAKISRGLFNGAATKAGREQQGWEQREFHQGCLETSRLKNYVDARLRARWNGILNTFFLPSFLSFFFSMFIGGKKGYYCIRRVSNVCVYFFFFLSFKWNGNLRREKWKIN